MTPTDSSFCDFCHDQLGDEVWRLLVRPVPGDDQESPIKAMMSTPWLGCPSCGALLEQKDWGGLLRRGFTSYMNKHPEHEAYRDEIEMQLRITYHYLSKHFVSVTKGGPYEA